MLKFTDDDTQFPAGGGACRLVPLALRRQRGHVANICSFV